jgi:hypothetical protein
MAHTLAFPVLPLSLRPFSSLSVLVDCSGEYDFLSCFDRRLAMPRWNVVFKALIVLHRLTIEGKERFMKDLAQNHHTFNLHSFFDASIGSQEHQEFIAKYADYLAQKVYVYKLLGVSVERRPPTESKEWARKLTGFDLVKSLPAISQQFDKLLLCAPYSNDVMHSAIPVAALTYLVKDAFRIYSTLTILMLGVVDHYIELDAPQTKLILTVCQTFRGQNLRFKKWTTELADLGFAHDKLFPELVPIPDALFELLQDHIEVQGGGRPKQPASSAAPGKKPAAAAAAPVKGGKKKPAPAPVESSEEEEKDPMDSDSDEEPQIRKVTKKTQQMAVSSGGGKKGKPVAQPAEEEEEGEDEEEVDSEEERERRERKAAKKARKEAKHAKKEAKKAKKAAKAAQQQQEEESEEEEEEEVAPPPKKAGKKKPAAAAGGEVDLFSVLDAPLASNRAPVASPPAFVMPVSSNVFQPYPAQAAPVNYGGYGHPQPYGQPAGVQYGAAAYGQQPYGAASALSQLAPLSSSARAGRGSGSGSASMQPGEENTTAVGGIHDPSAGAGARADPFGDLGPDLSAAKGKTRR